MFYANPQNLKFLLRIQKSLLAILITNYGWLGSRLDLGSSFAGESQDRQLFTTSKYVIQ